MNNKYEVYKVKRAIRRSGIDVKFYRPLYNEYNEPIKDEYEYVLCVKCLYHEHTAHMLDTYIFNTGTDSGTTRLEKSPQLLCITEDLLVKDDFDSYLYEDDTIHKSRDYIVKVGDFVDFNGHHAIVTALKDVMEWNMICDVSFEEVDNGSISGV